MLGHSRINKCFSCVPYMLLGFIGVYRWICIIMVSFILGIRISFLLVTLCISILYYLTAVYVAVISACSIFIMKSKKNGFLMFVIASISISCYCFGINIGVLINYVPIPKKLLSSGYVVKSIAPILMKLISGIQINELKGVIPLFSIELLYTMKQAIQYIIICFCDLTTFENAFYKENRSIFSGVERPDTKSKRILKFIWNCCGYILTLFRVAGCGVGIMYPLLSVLIMPIDGYIGTLINTLFGEDDYYVNGFYKLLLCFWNH